MRYGVLALAGALLASGASPATAQAVESCSYDSSTKAITAVIAAGGEATLRVEGGQILFGADPQPCGAATTTNTDSISIAGEAGSDEVLVLDQRGGFFGPGTAPDPGTQEIEIVTTLGDTTDRVVVFGTEGDDYMAAGQSGFATSEDGDVDITFSPNTFELEVHLLGGNDHFDGRGTGGAGLIFLGPVTATGGAGDETLLRGGSGADNLDGGPGNDLIDAQGGNDVLTGGPGNDILAAGGGDDELTGGPGADDFRGSDGDDVIYASDLEADTQIHGGPGTDTAYFDPGLDPAPVVVENRVPDSTPPVVVCDAPDGEWHADDVVLACTAEDPESLLADPADATFALSTSVAAGIETADAATGSRVVCNRARLCTTVGPVDGNKVDKKVPANPTDVESTHHQLNVWSPDRTVSVAYTPATDGGSGVDGLSFSWTRSATSSPDRVKDREETSDGLTSPVLGNGRWYLHIAAVDNVGNWSDADHYGPFLVDGTPPRVKALAASGRADQSLRLRYRTGDNTDRTRERVTVRRAGSLVTAWSRPFATAEWSTIQSVRWQPGRAGTFTFCVRAWDEAGNNRRDCATVTVRA